MLEQQHDHDVKRRDDAPPDERDAEEQLQPNGRPDHLRQVAGGNRQLTENPEEIHRRPRVMVATGLGEVAARGHPELDAQVLEDDRHHVRDHDDGQQRVAELRAAREVGRPVARVHVAHRHQEARPGKREDLAPERGPGRHRDGPVHLRQALRRPPALPARLSGNWRRRTRRRVVHKWFASQKRRVRPVKTSASSADRERPSCTPASSCVSALSLSISPASKVVTGASAPVSVATST